MTTSLASLLAKRPFFAGMSEASLAVLAECASEVEFAAGTTIFREGDEADACYLITGGDVALEIVVPGRGPHVVETLHSGEVLGWSWLFPPYRWSFDAQALTETHAIRFDGAALREAKTSDSQFGYELMTRFARVLVDRLQATRVQLLDIYGTAH
jgi:CRP/FNR family cyclic AMP-dependent transcriptional regulator